MKILIVEDSPADQQLLMHHLRSLHSHLELKVVDTLQGAREALSKEKFVVTFLDKFLPDCDAIEQIEAFLEDHPLDKIIILTGDEDRINVMKCLQAGALDFLIKPLLNSNDLKRILTYAELRSIKN